MATTAVDGPARREIDAFAKTLSLEDEVVIEVTGNSAVPVELFPGIPAGDGNEPIGISPSSAGSDAGGRRAAAIYTLIETCKLNDVDPRAWLADVLKRLPDHPAKRIHELLPWNWKPESATARAA